MLLLLHSGLVQKCFWSEGRVRGRRLFEGGCLFFGLLGWALIQGGCAFSKVGAYSNKYGMSVFWFSVLPRFCSNRKKNWGNILLLKIMQVQVKPKSWCTGAQGQK